MNFITLKELKKMVPVASEFKRVPGLKKILEDGIEVILRKQMENHAEVVVYKNGYVSYHAHERYTVFALHNCTHYYYESQGNEHQTIPHTGREILKSNGSMTVSKRGNIGRRKRRRLPLHCPHHKTE